jgi:hypothetical protein
MHAVNRMFDLETEIISDTVRTKMERIKKWALHKGYFSILLHQRDVPWVFLLWYYTLKQNNRFFGDPFFREREIMAAILNGGLSFFFCAQ